MIEEDYLADEIIAFCGLNCTECPAYIGTQEEDEILLKKTAKRWSTAKHKIESSDILCDGCASPGKRLASICAECQVRICGVGKAIENCGFCDDYPCQTLETVWKWLRTPKAKARLDEIKQNRE